VKSRLTLVGLDIEGEWNVPLLANAAEMSEASLLFARSTSPTDEAEEGPSVSSAPIDALLGQFDHLLACELTKQSRTVYEYAAPRGHVGVIVGNERCGVPRGILKKVDQVVSIPMVGRGLSSVNVAVAASIILYSMERDLGRKHLRTSALIHSEVDVLIVDPPDPSELGSLLRSAWAFGWQRVFLADRRGVWFTKDRPTVLAGRVAARCEVNRIVVSPNVQLNIKEYDRIVVCDNSRSGTPLTRFTLPDRGRVLLVYGDADPSVSIKEESMERVFVDYATNTVDACFRHTGSILLSVISQRLRRSRRG
jgi:tRNA G18 (ribose-2'-O)-methylase SpoU